MPDAILPEQPWAETADAVLRGLGVRPEAGLDRGAAAERRRRFGPNTLRGVQPKRAAAILLDQFRSLIVLLLAVAAALSFVFGDWIEGFAVVGVLVLNALIGFFTELRAVRSMEALRRLGRVSAKVRRDGRALRIPAGEVVPGDILLLEGGDVLAADARITSAATLEADESMLTGESVPVSKNPDPAGAGAPLAERGCMLFKGTAVTRGAGEAVVTATGMRTEVGRISRLVAEAEDETTPLEKRLAALGRRLVGVTLAVAALAALAGIAAGKEVLLMVETGIALAVAAIPEGLPVVATMALARGMRRMARRNALVNRLSSVETLGATSVICTDKTGTLTENRMTVERVATDGGLALLGGARGGPPGEPVRRVLEIGALCNNAALAVEGEGDDHTLGDPLEVALLRAARDAGIDPAALRAAAPREREVAFDSDTKMMATFHRTGAGQRVAVKGAAEPVLEACTRRYEGASVVALSGGEREQWLQANRDMASGGLRVIAAAENPDAAAGGEPYRELVFAGLLGLLDPPREDVREALARCREAGVTVVMATGDQAATALNVARVLDLAGGREPRALSGRDLGEAGSPSGAGQEAIRAVRVFARVSPAQKLDIIAAHQAAGAVIAMTGDGVNDAPALKQADIGIAMGLRGTEVAREAADMVLQDDAFSTIVAAIEEGRAIFGNIRKLVLFLMACNLSEIFVVGLASAVNAPLPIRPIQILFLNLVTDVFPALALGMGEADPAAMRQPPRPAGEPVLARRHWLAAALYGGLITVGTLGAFAAALLRFRASVPEAVTIAFLVLAFSQLWMVFNLRDRGTGFLRNDITRNRYVWGAVALCAALLVAAVHVPPFARVLSLTPPGARGWALALGASLVPWAVGQVAHAVRNRRGRAARLRRDALRDEGGRVDGTVG